MSNNLALYRKYRSKNLDEILGQPQVIDILKVSAEKDSFAHSYLLVGQRGTGKTSVARILAHLINATNYSEEDFDIIEIDAASHGSVDDARELRERANLAPMKSRNKVYIIDEVHMLSRQAFDALLKLIEEPPKHLYLILATTELSKVPATILSRVQKFTFKPVAQETVAAHLREISDKEKITITDQALALIAKKGGGSFRDSITILDQIKEIPGEISRESVEQTLGLASSDEIETIIGFIEDGNTTELVKALNGIFLNGFTPAEITNQLIDSLANSALADPTLYNLIDKLLDAPKSFNPKIKLVSVLGSFSERNSIKEISQKTIEKPAQKSVSKSATASTDFFKVEKKIEMPVLPKPENNEVDFANDDDLTEVKEDMEFNEITEEIPEMPVKETANNEEQNSEFNWENVIEEFEKLEEPAAYALVKNATIRNSNNELKLYFAKKFWRIKADTKNFRDILDRAIANSKQSVSQIKVESEPAPEDSDAAKVLDIIGGDVISL